MKNKIIISLVTVILVILVFITCNSIIKKKSLIDTIYSESGITYGNDEASIKIVEYLSFQCIDCAEQHNSISKKLKYYIDEGIVSYTIKPLDVIRFPYDNVIFTHIKSIEDYESIDKIFATYNEWTNLQDENEVIEYLGLLNEEIPGRDIIMQEVRTEVEKLEINAIPTTFINGKSYVDLRESEFISIIEKEMK